jgi:hypothetical protein
MTAARPAVSLAPRRSAPVRWLVVVAAACSACGGVARADVPAARFEQLAAEAGQAATAFRPVEAPALDAAARNLREALRPLTALLARSKSGPDWKAYLDWPTLEAQAAAGSAADPAALRRLESRLNSAETGLDMPDFVRVRKAVTRYAEAADAAKGAGAKRCSQRLESLAAALRSAAANGSLTSLASAGPTLERLGDAGQAPGVIRGIRETLGRPNMVLEVHERLFAQAVDRPVDEVEPVRENILGTTIRGTGRTTGMVHVDFVPSTDRAAFDLVLAARNVSQTRGTQGPVTVHSQGFTDIGARRRIFLDDRSISAAPVQASASTATQISGINVNSRFGKRIIRRIANRKIAESKPRAEAVAESRARDRIRREFTTQTDPAIAQFRSEFQNRVRRPLESRGLYPEWIHINSTDSALVTTARKASPVQLAAASFPPPAAADNVLTARIHESAVNNALEQQFGGKIFTQDDAAKLAADFQAKMPESLGTEADQQPWAITFAKHRPISVTAADGRLTVMVRGDKFVSGERDFPGMDISATYAIGRMSPGGYMLVREGDVQIYPPGFKPGSGEKLSPAETSVRRILQRRFDKLLKADIEVPDLELQGELAHAGPLPMQQLEAHNDGWIVAGWRKKDRVISGMPTPATAAIAPALHTAFAGE